MSDLFAGPDFESDTVCAGTSTSFTILGATGVTFVSWDFGDLLSTSDTSNNFNPTYSYPYAGLFTVKLVFYIGSIKDSVQKNILVLGTPSPSLPPDYNVCQGTYGLNANYPWGDSYLWSTGASTQGIQYSVPGTYWIQVTNICGIGTDTVHVTFIYPPTYQLVTTSYLCPNGDEDTLIAGPNNPSYSYQWASGQTTNSIIVNTPGNYFVQISNQCGLLSCFSNVYFLAPPVVELGADDTILCGNAQLDFDVNILTCDFCYYNWSDGQIVPFNTITSEGITWVTISNECGVASDSVNINYLNYPDVVFGNDTTICNDNFLSYNLSLENGDFLWQDGTTDSSYVIDTTGKYYVTIHNYCATLTDTINVKKLTLSLDFEFTDTLLCREEKLELNITQPEGIYLWNTGATDSVITISSEGIYEVSVSNYCGVLEDDITVYYENCNDCLHIPSAFTPNQDGHNDYFRVMHDCILINYEIHIYNRWGEEVYASTNPDFFWDGSYNGKALPIETYVYQLSYTKSDLKNEISEYKKGNITLLR